MTALWLLFLSCFYLVESMNSDAHAEGRRGRRKCSEWLRAKVSQVNGTSRVCDASRRKRLDEPILGEEVWNMMCLWQEQWL